MVSSKARTAQDQGDLQSPHAHLRIPRTIRGTPQESFWIRSGYCSMYEMARFDYEIKEVVTATPSHVSVFNHSDEVLRATASADNMGTHWWVGRVLVDPPSRRGCGVGGRLVRALLKGIVKQGGTEVHVAPGGYGEDQERQFKFYKKLGFVRENEQGLFIWRHVEG